MADDEAIDPPPSPPKRRGREDSPVDRRRGREDSPEFGRRGRDYSPDDWRRGREDSPDDRKRGRDDYPDDRKRGRDDYPDDRRRFREDSPDDRRRGRDYSPDDRRRGRDYSPDDRRRGRRDSPDDRGHGRKDSSDGRRTWKDYSPNDPSDVSDVKPKKEEARKLDKPWRNGQTFEPTDEEKLRAEVLQYQPLYGLLEYCRVLLVGPVGVGKSSTINSFVSAVEGRMKEVARTQSHSGGGGSATRQYNSFPLRSGDGKEARILLCDSMGLEPKDTGLQMEDLKNILDGKLQEGDKLDRANERFEDQSASRSMVMQTIQLVVLVLHGGEIDLMDEDVKKKMRDVAQAARNKDIVVIALCTKLDTDSYPTTRDDLESAFLYTETRAMAEKVDQCLGVGVDNIFFTANYVPYENMSPTKNILALRCLSRMLQMCDHTLTTQKRHLAKKKEAETAEKKQEDEAQTPLDRKLRDPWSKKLGHYLEKLENFQTGYNVREICILPVGPIDSGKSSFINSVQSMLEDRLREVFSVRTAAVHHGPATTKLEERQLKSDRGEKLKFVIQNVMGVGEKKGIGLQQQDMMMLIEGHIKPNYVFNEKISIQKKDHYFDPKPDVYIRPHVLAVFVDASTASTALTTSSSMSDKLYEAVQHAKAQGMKVAVILTKVDLLAKEIERDVTVADTHRQVKKVMKHVSGQLGVPEFNIYYVQNYTDEAKLEKKKNVLLAYVMKELLQLGTDALEEMAKDRANGLKRKEQPKPREPPKPRESPKQRGSKSYSKYDEYRKREH